MDIHARKLDGAIGTMPIVQAKTAASGSSMPSWRYGNFTHQEKFVKLLKSVGVKTAADTIADIFFNGNVNSVRWLYRVLIVEAEGFVEEYQAKLIIPSWAFYWGISYNYDEFFGT